MTGNGPSVPLRLDCPTGQMHGVLLSTATRLIYEHLCTVFPVKCLSEVCHIASGGTPSKGVPGYWEGGISWVTPKDMKSFLLTETTDSITELAVSDGKARLVKAPASLLVTRGMILSRYVPVVHADNDFTVNQDIRVVRSASTSLDGLYLSAMLLGAERELFSKVTDSTAGQRRIETVNLSSLGLPLCDLEDQEVIGQFVLDISRSSESLHATLQKGPSVIKEPIRVFTKVAHMAADIEEAQELRDRASQETGLLWPNALRKVLTGGLSGRSVVAKESGEELLCRQAEKYSSANRPRYNNAHPHDPQILDNGPSELPSGWAWTTLGSVLTHLVDCVNDTPEFADHPTGYLGLKSTNVKPYLFDLSDKWFVTPEDCDHWNRREQPQSGDVLLTREAPMGQACILPEGHSVCLTQRLMLLRTDPAFVHPEFLLHYLNSPHFHSQVLDVCRGLTTPHIRVKDAPGFLIAIPPYQEQVHLVEFLRSLQSEVEELKALQAKTTVELHALMPSILDQAFHGEL